MDQFDITPPCARSWARGRGAGIGGLVQTRTYDFDALLLQEARSAVDPAAVGSLIRLAKRIGARDTARELEAVQDSLSDNCGYPADFQPLGGWSIEN